MLANPRQSLFVTEYLKDGDKNRAARVAGVRCKNISTAASRLLKRPGIRAEIEFELNNIREATRVTKSFVVANLKRVAERAMRAQPVLDAEGNETGEFKFDSAGANRALELLGKSLGIFIDRQVSVTMTLEQLLEQTWKTNGENDQNAKLNPPH